MVFGYNKEITNKFMFIVEDGSLSDNKLEEIIQKLISASTYCLYYNPSTTRGIVQFETQKSIRILQFEHPHIKFRGSNIRFIQEKIIFIKTESIPFHESGVFRKRIRNRFAKDFWDEKTNNEECLKIRLKRPREESDTEIDE